jgi:BASS family bile acid:Na+ symporter
MPMAIGMAIRLAAETLAEKAHPVVKKVTDINNVIMLVAALVIYRSDFLSAVGTYAIGSQFLYYGLLAAGAYGLGFGLPHAQKSVLALGVCTRNIGAALAPLFTGFAGARVLARFAPAGEPATAQTGGGS